MKTIKINKDVKYLSDVMKELPKNCIFDKGATGAGGTTIALTEKANTIICVPFTELIKNKVSQVNDNINGIYPYEVFGLYAGVSIRELKDYLSSDVEFKKVMVTYDSLPKLMKYINVEEYDLLVDEYHILTHHYLFRDKAVKGVLNNFNKFKSYTFMTATPVKDEYTLDELESVDVVSCDWEEPTIVEFIPTKCKSLKGTLIRVINSQLEGKGVIKDANLHIFCNSVDFIKTLIEQCKLTSNDCRAIYGKSNKTKLPGIKNSSTTDPVKKINFYTSTTFEGADIYDENAITLVVSDVTKEHSLLDISTQITQIAGRVRNSNYASKVYHFFNTNKYLDNNFITAEEFKQKVLNDLDAEKLDIDYINKSANIHKLAEGMDYLVFNEDKGVYEVDGNRIKWEVRNFEILRGIYRTKVNVLKEYRDSKMVASLGDVLEDEFIKIPLNTEDDITIAECLKKLEGLSVEGLQYQLTMMSIGEIYDWLPEAIEVLGVEKIEDLNYNKGNIMKAVNKQLNLESKDSVELKVVKILDTNKRIKTGMFISSKEVKEVLQKTYDDLGLDLKAKATDLDSYFVTEAGVKKIAGKTVRGVVILLPKYKL